MEDFKKYIGWLNKNSVFDRSTGEFEKIDFFTFLENLSEFDYEEKIIYDDFYYILEYTKDSVLHLIKNLNKSIKREHKILPISKAKEFDKESILWISKKPGRTLSEKLFDGKIKTVKRYENTDTYENRLLKRFLKEVLNTFEIREDLSCFEDYIYKIRKFLKSDEAKSINEYGKINYNNILLHHKHYKKIFKAYKWLNSLEEKYRNIKIDLNLILKYELLYQKQYFTDKLIHPDTLYINYENFLIEDRNLNIKINKKKFEFHAVRKVARKILEKHNEIKTNRLFNKKFIEKDIFIDLFRLYPIAKINDEIIKFPILLRQKINDSIVNANNTKIINLKYDFFTLPEILSTYDTEIFKYFLEDLQKYFIDSKIYYVLPDFVNEFKFSKVKKLFNSYFKSKVVPKSVLAGLTYIFENKIKEDNTLIYIQRGSDNYLYITPLLVKKDKEFFLERHPTKKLKESKELVKELERYFNKKLANKIFTKFLQNGIKQAKKEIIFANNDKKISIKKIKIPNNKSNNIEEIKKLYPNNKDLFKNYIFFIEDSNKKNLSNYQKLIKFESQGRILWKDHLPKLSMQTVKNGYFDEFVLVDDNMELINNKIEIKENFIIPAGIKELSFPLILENKNIDFEAYITSTQMPFEREVKCKLKLIYDYEAENIYKLTFIPLDKKYYPLNVKWKEIQYNNNLAYPDYPKKKNIDELVIFNEKNGKATDLIDWMKKNFDYIIDLYELINGKHEKAFISEHWQKDKNGYEYQYLEISGGNKVRLYKNSIKVKDTKSIIFRTIKEKRHPKINGLIISDKENHRFRKKVMLPLYYIFKDRRNINEFDENFIEKFKKSIDAAKKIIESNIYENIKKELFYYLSSLNKYSPVLNKLVKLVDEDLDTYKNNFAYAIGCMEKTEQEEIFNKLLSRLEKSNDETEFSNILKIFGIVFYRCENIIFKLTEENIRTILSKLLISLNLKLPIKELVTKNDENRIKTSVILRLELLLAMLRLRKVYPSLLHPQKDLTKEYIKIIDSITKKVINKEFNSRIEIKVDKPKEFQKTPDLLYALRLYLSGDSGANSIKITGLKEN